MRIATYNVENLFSRVHAMNGDEPEKTSAVPRRAGRSFSRSRAGVFTPTGRSWRKGARTGSARSNGGDLIQAPAIENTGRIIQQVKADVLCLVEVESRPVLRRFDDTILKSAPYPHEMFIDGNDQRGIDVGLLCRRPVTDMRSHIDDLDPVTRWPVLSRDCAEFELDLPGTRHLWVLVNLSKAVATGAKLRTMRNKSGSRKRSRPF